MAFVATMNTPGYMPWDDDPPVFDTAAEAWEYLADERTRQADEAEDAGIDVERDVAPLMEEALTGNEGTVYLPTPGREGDEHDLGIAYSVTYLHIRDELPCGCRPHYTRMTQWGFRCDTEDQGYCNFECPHEEEDE